MSYIDIVIIIPILWGLYRGFVKGLVIQIASLISLILGIYIGVKFSDIASSLLENNFTMDKQYLGIISFVVTFLVVVVGIHFIAKLLEKIINMVAMGIFNKLLGSLLGAAKYGLIISVLLLIINSIDAKLDIVSESEKRKSVLYAPMLRIVPAIIPSIKDLVGKDRNESLV
ncbi:MAG: colicin V production protein [Bacteroidetes bacterium]|nr:MAG: colicin V production protein [Bacteroidota bacterium]